MTKKGNRDSLVGSVLVEYWLNSLTFYMAVSCTEKTLTLSRVPDKLKFFEELGGATGYRHVAPALERFDDTKRFKKKVEFLKNGSFIAYGEHGGYLFVLEKDKEGNWEDCREYWS